MEFPRPFPFFLPIVHNIVCHTGYLHFSLDSIYVWNEKEREKSKLIENVTEFLRNDDIFIHGGGNGVKCNTNTQIKKKLAICWPCNWYAFEGVHCAWNHHQVLWNHCVMSANILVFISVQIFSNNKTLVLWIPFVKRVYRNPLSAQEI